MRTFGRRAELEVPDLRRAIDETNADALLVDINTWGGLAAAEAWGGPWASWCPYPLPLPSRDAPPFGPGFRPARGRAGRLRDALLRPVLFGSLERLVRPLVSDVRARVGLSPVKDAKAMFTTPPLLLYLTAEPFEYPRSDWPPNVRLVGPCDWDPPAETPAWLEEVQEPIVQVQLCSVPCTAAVHRSGRSSLAAAPTSRGAWGRPPVRMIDFDRRLNRSGRRDREAGPRHRVPGPCRSVRDGCA
jgi:UDP:flavonoid glycosyltransferase YjiC (YdhE family)